jgi:hypothetical protein
MLDAIRPAGRLPRGEEGRPMRPLLLPTLARLWRDATTLQIGVDPRRAVVISPIDAATASFLGSLDGRRSLAEVLAGAPESAGRLVEELVGYGAVVDAESGAPRPLQRREAAVLVRCRGRLGPATAVLLAAAGVGRVAISGSGVVGDGDVGIGGLGSEDLGRPYAVAVTDAVRRAAPGIDTRQPVQPNFVVLAAGPLPVPADQVRWVTAGIPHLPVLLRDGRAVVGPLVVPGRTACLSCVEEHRRDRDPVWPVLAAQLATDQRPEQADALVVCSAAALAATEVLSQLDGRLPATAGASLEVGAPGEPLRRREWSAHPRCGCAPVR